MLPVFLSHRYAAQAHSHVLIGLKLAFSSDKSKPALEYFDATFLRTPSIYGDRKWSWISHRLSRPTLLLRASSGARQLYNLTA